MLMEKLGRLSTILEKGTSFSPLRKAPVFALLCAQKSDPKSWAEIGRIFERIFLKATSLKLKFKPVCSFIAEEYAREKLTSFLPDPKWIALQPFTFGYAKDGPPLQKKKRPLKTMLVK
jgi:hypothetical protein